MQMLHKFPSMKYILQFFLNLDREDFKDKSVWNVRKTLSGLSLEAWSGLLFRISETYLEWFYLKLKLSWRTVNQQKIQICISTQTRVSRVFSLTILIFSKKGNSWDTSLGIKPTEKQTKTENSNFIQTALISDQIIFLLPASYSSFRTYFPPYFFRGFYRELNRNKIF